MVGTINLNILNSKSNSSKEVPISFKKREYTLERSDGQDIFVKIKQNKNSSIFFTAGFKHLEGIIARTDMNRVSRQFEKLGIQTDFQNNKIVAASSGFTANIFMKLGLPLPTGLYVRDLSKLFGPKQADSCAVCLPDNMKGYEIRSVIFNSSKDWQDIDATTEYCKSHNHWATNHFLNVFLHEFNHNAHIDHLYKKYGYYGLDKRYKLNPKYSTGGLSIISELNKHCNIDTTRILVSKGIGEYAAKTRMESVAEYMTKVIVTSLDQKTAMPRYNPFVFSQFINGKTLDEIVTKTWEGILT
jgi:hypothetical protein